MSKDIQTGAAFFDAFRAWFNDLKKLQFTDPNFKVHPHDELFVAFTGSHFNITVIGNLNPIKQLEDGPHMGASLDISIQPVAGSGNGINILLVKNGLTGKPYEGWANINDPDQDKPDRYTLDQVEQMIISKMELKKPGN